MLLLWGRACRQAAAGLCCVLHPAWEDKLQCFPACSMSNLAAKLVQKVGVRTTAGSVCILEGAGDLVWLTLAHATVPQHAHAVIRPEGAVTPQAGLEVGEVWRLHQLLQQGIHEAGIQLVHGGKVAACMGRGISLEVLHAALHASGWPAC